MQPFLTILTATHKRPHGLTRLMASIQQQTAVDCIEHLILPDYVGIGIPASLYGRLPLYAPAVHGRYVQLLGDDDVLASPDVVGRLRQFVSANGEPPVVLVTVQKGPWMLPAHPAWPPVCGRIDLACLIVREDVWRSHLHCYGHRYEGDFDFAEALHRSGHEAHCLDVIFASGGVGRGATE